MESARCIVDDCCTAANSGCCKQKTCFVIEALCLRKYPSAGCIDESKTASTPKTTSTAKNGKYCYTSINVTPKKGFCVKTAAGATSDDNNNNAGKMLTSKVRHFLKPEPISERTRQILLRCQQKLTSVPNSAHLAPVVTITNNNNKIIIGTNFNNVIISNSCSESKTTTTTIISTTVGNLVRDSHYTSDGYDSFGSLASCASSNDDSKNDSKADSINSSLAINGNSSDSSNSSPSSSPSRPQIPPRVRKLVKLSQATKFGLGKSIDDKLFESGLETRVLTPSLECHSLPFWTPLQDLSTSSSSDDETDGAYCSWSTERDFSLDTYVTRFTLENQIRTIIENNRPHWLRLKSN